MIAYLIGAWWVGLLIGALAMAWYSNGVQARLHESLRVSHSDELRAIRDAHQMEVKNTGAFWVQENRHLRDHVEAAALVLRLEHQSDIARITESSLRILDANLRLSGHVVAISTPAPAVDLSNHKDRSTDENDERAALDPEELTDE